MHCSKQKNFSKIICHCSQLRGSKISSIGGLLESLQLSTWLPNSLLVCTKLQVFPTPLKSSSLTTVTQWMIQICDGRFAFVFGCHSLSVRFFPCGSGFGEVFGGKILPLPGSLQNRSFSHCHAFLGLQFYLCASGCTTNSSPPPSLFVTVKILFLSLCVWKKNLSHCAREPDANCKAKTMQNKDEGNAINKQQLMLNLSIVQL